MIFFNDTKFDILSESFYSKLSQIEKNKSMEEVKKAEEHLSGSKGSTDSTDSELTLLLVSDIHGATEELDKLIAHCKEKIKERINYVIVLGDFDNLNNDDPDTHMVPSSKLESIAREELLKLESLSVPVLYIPGNHDAPSLYTDKPTLTKQSVNIQGKAYKLAEGIQIVGFGGSVPGYIKGKEHWPGWPYKSEEEYATKFKEIAQIHLNYTTQTLLATHVGPFSSSTSRDTFEKFPEIIKGGCKYLDEVNMKEENNILANLHGHIHEGTGRANLHRKEIINPGSVKQGNFAILRLGRGPSLQRWDVKSLELISFDYASE